jgi:hypothetical protein
MAAAVSIVGGVASVSAAQLGAGADSQLAATGYGKDQCKDGGWKNFKNPDGSPMFKNQGQCIAFFVSSGAKSGANVNTSNVDVQVNNNQSAHSGNAHDKSGDVTISGDTNVSITSSQ